MNTTKYSDRFNLQEEDLFETENTTEESESMTEEELKIESLKIATNIAKLMSNVTTEDIVDIAATVARFIKGDSDSPVEEEGDEEDEEDEEDSKEPNTDDDEDFEV